MSLQDSRLINQDSGNKERYTPARIIEAARRTMGGIDLDPASCALANETVKAQRYFTREQDGLAQRWTCNSLWLNHPYSRGEDPCKPNCKKKTCLPISEGGRGYHCAVREPSNAEWIDKLVNEYAFGNTDQACCLVFASTSEEWIQRLLDYPMCVIKGRVRHPTPEQIEAGTEPKAGTKGSAVFYLGVDTDRFYDSFRELGKIYIPYGYNRS